jgi:hypothetical protein
MHCLENMLLIMSKRIRAGESNNQKLADDLETLASESHRYVPEGGKEALAELNDKWSRKYGHLMKSS